MQQQHEHSSHSDSRQGDQSHGTIARSSGHTHDDGEDNEGGIAGVFHNGSEADNGECAHQAKSAGEVVAYDQGHQADQHAEKHQGGGQVVPAITAGQGETVNQRHHETEENGKQGAFEYHIQRGQDWREGSGCSRCGT